MDFEKIFKLNEGTTILEFYICEDADGENPQKVTFSELKEILQEEKEFRKRYYKLKHQYEVGLMKIIGVTGNKIYLLKNHSDNDVDWLNDEEEKGNIYDWEGEWDEEEYDNDEASTGFEI